MSDSEKRPGQEEAQSPDGIEKKPRRPYKSPRILSVERLEAAAAVCDPPTGGYGKDSIVTGGSCVTLGS